MEQIISALEKIRAIAAGGTSRSTIEKDLMLQYTRDLYATILALDEEQSVPAVPALTEEPEPLPEEIPEEELHPVAATVVAEEEEEAAAEEEELPALIEEELLEEGKAGEPELQDEPDRSELYTDLALQEEEPAATIVSFELEPELREEKPAAYQARHSTDFRVWNKDIRSYIGINDKYNFISELFRGNSEAYDEILNEINQCENKQDALRFLENAGITTLYHWQEDGFSEQIFYNVLSQFFAAR